MAKAGDDEAAAPVQKSALRMVDTLHQAGGNTETRIEQHAPVIGKASLPVGKMDRRREKDRGRRMIKLREHSHKPIKLRNLNMRLGDAAIEHIVLVELLDKHKPIDRGSGSANRETIAGIHQRQDVEIDVRRQRAIEPQLGAAGGLAPRKRRKVEIGKADRLFEFVDPVAGQKDP